MSAFPNVNEADNYVKRYITARLEQAAHTSLLRSSDELFDYLTEAGGLDRTCTEWIHNAPNVALRELLNQHQIKYHKIHAGARQTPHGVAGPSVQRFVDSTYYSSDPGSPMSEGVHSRSQESNFEVYLVSAAAPDTDPVPALGKVDIESNRHVIDYEIAKSLCGDRITVGQNVRVRYRQTQEDRDGNKTKEISCVVGQIQDVNILFARDFGRSKAYSEPGSTKVLSSGDDAEIFRRMRAKNAALLLDAMAEQDVLRHRKRSPDDDGGGQRVAQRRRREGPA